MIAIEKNVLATLEFAVQWKSDFVRHQDIFFAQKVNFWRDILPAEVTGLVSDLEIGETVTRAFSGKDALQHDEKKKMTVSRQQFCGRYPDGSPVEPRFGRFYPRAFLKGAGQGGIQPFRCIGLEPSRITADLNHPLADFDFNLDITLHNYRKKKSEIGGQISDWMEIITNGPGMQARWHGKPTDFFSGAPFARPDQSDDLRFYEKPRMVTHTELRH